VLGLDGFELDSDLLAGDDVGSQIDITEGTATDLAANAVLVADTKILRRSAAMPWVDRVVTVLFLADCKTYHSRHFGGDDEMSTICSTIVDEK
jgi:hypothetical protein